MPIKLHQHATPFSINRFKMIYRVYLSYVSVCVTTLVFGVGSTSARAATITARTPALTDVTVAVSAAGSGDIVKIPAGSATWNSPVVVTKPIQIIGASYPATSGTVPATSTIIRNGGTAEIFKVTADTTTPYLRLSGITFGGTSTVPNGYALSVTGSAKAFRVDHCRFMNGLKQKSIATRGDLYGLFDHIVFEFNVPNEVASINHTGWNRAGLYGDNSWSDTAYRGTEKA